MPTGRVISLCVFLFLVSALISTAVRSGHYTTKWPSFTHFSKTTTTSHLAFATFLAGKGVEKSGADALPKHEEEDDSKDGYYVGARVLAYQLLHNPATRSNASIPFLVIVTPDVSQRKRARLIRDGATVVEIDRLNAAWVHPGAERWRDVLAKLRLFQMTQYSKICFIDADMLVTGSLEGVFDDPATDLLRTKHEPTQLREDEKSLPQTYMFAGKSDAFGYDHALPPKPADYLNSGFFVFAPSIPLFEYYVSLLKLPNRFDPGFPEQNLLNYAHRREGNMPWAQLGWRWNMNWPTMRDFEGGARSFHAKYWDDDPTHDQELKRKWLRQRAEMEGYYLGVEEKGRKAGW